MLLQIHVLVVYLVTILTFFLYQIIYTIKMDSYYSASFHFAPLMLKSKRFTVGPSPAGLGLYILVGTKILHLVKCGMKGILIKKQREKKIAVKHFMPGIWLKKNHLIRIVRMWTRPLAIETVEKRESGILYQKLLLFQHLTTIHVFGLADLLRRNSKILVSSNKKKKQ